MFAKEGEGGEGEGEGEGRGRGEGGGGVIRSESVCGSSMSNVPHTCTYTHR